MDGFLENTNCPIMHPTFGSSDTVFFADRLTSWSLENAADNAAVSVGQYAFVSDNAFFQEKSLKVSMPSFVPFLQTLSLVLFEQYKSHFSVDQFRSYLSKSVSCGFRILYTGTE